jgi:hypothetical protein
LTSISGICTQCTGTGPRGVAVVDSQGEVNGSLSLFWHFFFFLYFELGYLFSLMLTSVKFCKWIRIANIGYHLRDFQAQHLSCRCQLALSSYFWYKRDNKVLSHHSQFFSFLIFVSYLLALLITMHQHHHWLNLTLACKKIVINDSKWINHSPTDPNSLQQFCICHLEG